MLPYTLKDPTRMEGSALALYALAPLSPVTSRAPLNGAAGSLPQSELSESIFEMLLHRVSLLRFSLAHKCFGINRSEEESKGGWTENRLLLMDPVPVPRCYDQCSGKQS